MWSVLTGFFSDWGLIGSGIGMLAGPAAFLFQGARKWALLAVGVLAVVIAFLVMQIRIDSRDKKILQFEAVAAKLVDERDRNFEAAEHNAAKIREMSALYRKELAAIERQRDLYSRQLKARDKINEEIRRAPSGPVPDAFLPLLRVR